MLSFHYQIILVSVFFLKIKDILTPLKIPPQLVLRHVNWYTINKDVSNVLIAEGVAKCKNIVIKFKKHRAYYQIYYATTYKHINYTQNIMEISAAIRHVHILIFHVTLASWRLTILRRMCKTERSVRKNFTQTFFYWFNGQRSYVELLRKRDSF